MTSWFKWLDLNIAYSQGSRPNYYPAEGVEPFLGRSNNVSATVTLRPQSHLRFDEIYYYTRLATMSGAASFSVAASRCDLHQSLHSLEDQLPVQSRLFLPGISRLQLGFAQ